MKPYKVKIDKEAITDIREIIEWYSQQQSELGIRLKKNVVEQIESLQRNPKVYIIRYHEIRCVLVKKFPYMIHYYTESLRVCKCKPA
jgi:plasmid stabilization system protein ParE